MKPKFSGKFFPKNTKILNFMNICPVGAELFPCGLIEGRTDRQINKTKVMVAFRNLANAPKMPDNIGLVHKFMVYIYFKYLLK